MLTARFYDTDVNYIIDVLRGAYKISCAGGKEDTVLAEFIDALEDCDFVQLVSDDEVLIDEG